MLFSLEIPVGGAGESLVWKYRSLEIQSNESTLAWQTHLGPIPSSNWSV